MEQKTERIAKKKSTYLAPQVEMVVFSVEVGSGVSQQAAMGGLLFGRTPTADANDVYAGEAMSSGNYFGESF